jgi:hypothetical protein
MDPQVASRARQEYPGGSAALIQVPPPTRCPRGHLLRAPRTLIRTISCSACGRHVIWRCYCGTVTYRPVLAANGCSLHSTVVDASVPASP